MSLRRALTRRAGAGIAILALVAVAAGLALDRAFPPDLSRLEPSVTVVDRHGALLRGFRTADGQWRLPAEPETVSDVYLRLLLATEDKRFYAHPGVDPFAVARALAQLATHGRVVSGGSTLTMQLARMLEPRPRTLRSKIIEAFRAVQIESRLSKRDILAAYLTLTPTGGNLQGVRAGSLAWFGTEPRHLDAPRAALLVALPQAPRALRPDAHGDAARRARDRLLERAARDGVIDTRTLAAALATPVPVARLPMPVLAPHMAERLAAAYVHPDGPIRTAVDASLQAGVERTLARTLDELPAPVNLAAMVVDRRTGEILVRAGSGRWRDAARRGMVDMSVALRSPGSTLKPFIYGMAFDALLAHPDSLVRDEPTRFDDYAPHDFDGTFRGDVTVRRALQMSLNLPAVTVLQRLGPIRFAALFREAGLPLAFDDETTVPSLPMALGGTGITLERLMAAYVALADGGTPMPLIERYGVAPPPPGDPLMRPAAADAVVDILAGVAPPKGTAPRGGRIAYKTGTSFRFRDGWAIGIDGSRVVGVWMGRADGGTCLPCVGAASAAILFRLFDQLAPDPLPSRALTPFFAEPPPPALARLDAAAPHLADAPRIAFPLPDAHLLVDAETTQILLAVEGGRRPYVWTIDGRPIASAGFSREAFWRPEGEGFTTVAVVDGDGRSDEVRVRLVSRNMGSR